MTLHNDTSKSAKWGYGLPHHNQELRLGRARVEAVARTSALELHAAEDRRAAAVIWRLGDVEVTPQELRHCLSRVGSHPLTGDDRAWMKLPRDASPDRVLAVLLGLLDAHFESPERAASLVLDQAEFLEILAGWQREEAPQPCPSCRDRAPGDV